VAWRGPSWRGVAAACSAAVGLLAVGAPIATADLADTSQSTETSVLVVGVSTDRASQRVLAQNGEVSDELPIVNAVAADVTPTELKALQNDPQVAVVPNARVDVMGVAAPAVRRPAAVFPETTGATLLDDDAVGRSVTVAVLDTGISRVRDLKRIVGGVDLSGEGDPFKDSYGHGTFVSGLIAGTGRSSDGEYLGEAPGASLVSIKVAGASGITDMATVISGIQWAVTNKDVLRIGVLNISLGAPPFPSSVINPLDQAVEAAWRAGIVVVTSAGNTGPINGTITSPGDDPLVITAGAIDDQGTARRSDDTMAAFSAVGPTAVDGWFKPDLVASGRSVVSLRVPGSVIDIANPSARIGDANFVGSGTSFSAAITSGAAALLRQLHPTWSPDRIKGALLAGTSPGPVGSPFVDGFGSLNVAKATRVTAVLNQVAPTTPTAPGTTVSLFITGAGSAWNGSSWNGSAWNGSAWNGSSWNGSAWNGSSWNGSSWNGSAWNGSAWNGSSWNGSSWNGSSWNGSSWNGSSWNGSSWNGSSWNGSSWNGSSWNGSAWN
jgi:serine protease AprX